MNKAMKIWNMLFSVMKYSSVQHVFKLFITFHYFQSIMVFYSMNKCLLWNLQFLLKPKESENSLTKVQALRCVKIVLGVECFKTEIRGFVLYECNETLDTDILQNGRTFVFLIYLLQPLILWLWKECMDWVNNVCLLLKAMNWLLWEKMMIKTVLQKVWNFFCNKCLWKWLDFKVSYSSFCKKRWFKQLFLTYN